MISKSKEKSKNHNASIKNFFGILSVCWNQIQEIGKNNGYLGPISPQLHLCATVGHCKKKELKSNDFSHKTKQPDKFFRRPKFGSRPTR